jgi:hypothetical protein
MQGVLSLDGSMGLSCRYRIFFVLSLAALVGPVQNILFFTYFSISLYMYFENSTIYILYIYVDQTYLENKVFLNILT